MRNASVLTKYQILTVALCATILFPLKAAGQQVFGETESSGVAYKKYVPTGESSIEVLVVGSGGTGIYEVGTGTDLGELFAITGFSVYQGDYRTRREVQLRLHRTNQGRRDLLYDASLEDFLSEPGRYPTLMDGDILSIEIQVRSRFVWTDIFTVVGGISSFVVLVDRVFQ